MSVSRYSVCLRFCGELPHASSTVHYDTSADSPAQVTISNADVTQDFNLTYANGDNGEPNNDKLTATPLADNTPLAACLDGANPIDGDDSEDWFKFDTSGPGLVKITVKQSAAWYSSIDLELFDSLDSTLWQTSSELANGNLEADLYLPSAGTYYVQLSSGDQDYVLIVNYP